MALSIVQARLVGLAHFSVGYIFTYAALLIASTSGKFGSFLCYIRAHFFRSMQKGAPFLIHFSMTDPTCIIDTNRNHYGKEKFDSEGEEEAKIGTKISFDSPILKK